MKGHKNTPGGKKGLCLWAIKETFTEEVALSRALKGSRSLLVGKVRARQLRGQKLPAGWMWEN